MSSTFGSGATKSIVDFNSTLEVVQRKALSTGRGVEEVGTVFPGVKGSQHEADS